MCAAIVIVGLIGTALKVPAIKRGDEREKVNSSSGVPFAVVGLPSRQTDSSHSLLSLLR
jgi:hypothetical protein